MKQLPLLKHYFFPFVVVTSVFSEIPHSASNFIWEMTLSETSSVIQVSKPLSFHYSVAVLLDLKLHGKMFCCSVEK